jgi:hypothetical protein
MDQGNVVLEEHGNISNSYMPSLEEYASAHTGPQYIGPTIAPTHDRSKAFQELHQVIAAELKEVNSMGYTSDNSSRGPPKLAKRQSKRTKSTYKGGNYNFQYQRSDTDWFNLNSFQVWEEI